MPRHTLLLDKPAGRFVDSFLLGNGTTGAAVAGGIGVEHFDVNSDTLWSGGPELEPYAAAAADRVPVLRAAIAAGDNVVADALARELQADERTQSFQPVGRLSWRYARPGAPERYSRSLDLARAVSTTRYDDAGRERSLVSFVSHPDGVLVAAGYGIDAPGILEFTSPHPVDVRSWNDEGVVWLVATGRSPSFVAPDTERDVVDPVRYDTAGPAADGTAAAGMAFAVVVAVDMHPGGPRLVCAVRTGFRGWDQPVIADAAPLVEEARDAVSRARAREFGSLLERHVADHSALFERTSLALEPPSGHVVHPAELAFDLGRYLLIASSRPGTQATNLQGMWNVDVRPPWCSDYTTNINTPMNYWPAETAGLPDLHEPLWDLIGGLVSRGRVTAERTYGFAGSVVHHNTDLWRFTAPVHGDPVWANWPSALPWLAAHTWQHIAFGRTDGEFLREVAIPAHRAAAAFVLDALVEGPEGLVQSPSTSPENLFVTPAGPAAVTAGAALDRELAIELFTHLLTLSERTGDGDDQLIARVRAAREKLAPPSISDGEIDEWAAHLKPVEPGHRHLSHLYGVYPGERITPARQREFAAAKRSLRQRLAHGGGQTGWSQSWILCLAARLRERELVDAALVAFTGPMSSESLLDLHPHLGWREGVVFQIDGNFGFVAGVAEMLLQSHADALELLPVLPTSWATGRVKGLRARGGHTVDIEWRDGALVQATVTSGDDGEIAVRTGADIVVTDAGGRSIGIRHRDGSSRIVGRRGASYRVTPA